VSGAFLRAGEPVDLDNCHREPIHIPGSIQPHGCLLALDPGSLEVLVTSANCADFVGAGPERALGTALADLLGAEAAAQIGGAAGGPQRGTTLLSVAGHDVLVHDSGGTLVAELLRQQGGTRPLTFTDTYRRAQSALSELNEGLSYERLLEVAVRRVRELTGFDRVMLYRFDADWNGEVVAEDRREDLNSFLGLHYPSTDIPRQARALYERNWIRLIADVDYEPSPLEPPANPLTGKPLDLSDAWLRSVSPIHVEYLQNMGVRASMSISLLRDGRLWGLIACHHSAGPHEPPYEACATVELLGQMLSVRVVEAWNQRRAREALAARSVLAELATAVQKPTASLGGALTGEGFTVRDLVAADGVVARLDGETVTVGDVPPRAGVDALAALLPESEPLALDTLAGTLPEGDYDPARTSGMLGIALGGGQFLMWFRRELVQAVDWGGDPHNKAIAEQEGGEVRLSPRKSFELWREEVRLRSAPWADHEVKSAELLRRGLIETLYARARHTAQSAMALQLSLLPDRLPEVEGMAMCARYLPTAGGEVGGDWYDVIPLDDGRLALVIGDVSGHGLEAAGTMGELRSALRALLLEADSPSGALGRLNRMVQRVLPQTFATCLVALLDPATGEGRVASCGHLPFALVAPDGGVTLGDVALRPPLGGDFAMEAYQDAAFTLPAGGTLVLYSDGLIERRREVIDRGFDRLVAAAADVGPSEAQCDALVAACRDPAAFDDATVLVVRRA
jgi:GAF domain-containing protein